MEVTVIGAGLAGSEAALQLAKRNIKVKLYEMRPDKTTGAHKTGDCAEFRPVAPRKSPGKIRNHPPSGGENLPKSRAVWLPLRNGV